MYKAEDTKLKREVALKFLPQVLTQDPEAKERFVQEAQAAAALDHPNICTVFEIDEIDDKTFIAMAFIKGESLKDKISSGSLRLDEALNIAAQVSEGLEEAHKKGIIHRDIKPANIMLTEKGQAKIMDFGLAKLEWGVDLTKTATIMGTVTYMSPEQARGDKVDNRTDIWSLGCVVYEMVTGHRPFKGDYEQAAMYSLLNEDPLPISQFRKDIPTDLERAILKSLEKNPRHRYEDIKAFKMGLSQSDICQKNAIPSIAVLPFVNMSADPENEYFSDGLSEELINALTKIKELRVVARTSSFAFKGEKIDIRDVGNKLNVKTLLEGSVRKAGSRVRVTAQLINVEDGYHLWSDRYDRDMEDIFAIQDEITEKIMEKLMVALDVAEKPPDERRPINIEAHDLYLKGRYKWNKFLAEKALSYYQQAIDKDKDYTIAYAAMAEAYSLLATGFDIYPSKDTMPKAREAAETALKLDPNLAEAYVSMGLVSLFYDWDKNAAYQNFQKALELNPNAASAHQWFEFYWTYMIADFKEALAHLKRAQELDPLNLLIKIRIGFIAIFEGDYDAAIDQFNKICDMEPNYALAHNSLMTTYAMKEMYEEAIAAGEKMLELGPHSVAYLGVFGHITARAGKIDKAKEILFELEERSKKGYVSSFWVAVLYLGLEDIDKAFEWLEKAYEERDGSMIYVTVPPLFDPVRSDPRYKQLLIKMGLENLVPEWAS